MQLEECLNLDSVLDERPFREEAVHIMGSRNHQPVLPAIVNRKVRKIQVEHDPAMDVPKGVENGLRVRHGCREICILCPRKVSTGDRMTGKERNLNKVCEALQALEGSARGSDCRIRVDGQRVAALDGKASKYVHLGTRSERYGGGYKTTMKCFKDNGREGQHAVISGWVKNLEHVTLRYLPVWLRDVLENVHKILPNPSIPLLDGKKASLWPAMVSGRNVFLNVHTDADFVWSMVTIVAKGNMTNNDAITCYFCFPTIGVAVPMRNGDILLFDPRVPHCVSSRRQGDVDSYCVSFYFDRLLSGGNDNSQELTEEEELLASEVLRRLENPRGGGN